MIAKISKVLHLLLHLTGKSSFCPRITRNKIYDRCFQDTVLVADHEILYLIGLQDLISLVHTDTEHFGKLLYPHNIGIFSKDSSFHSIPPL